MQLQARVMQLINPDVLPHLTTLEHQTEDGAETANNPAPQQPSHLGVVPLPQLVDGEWMVNGV